VIELKEIFLRKADIESSIYYLKENKESDLIRDKDKELSELELILKQLCEELNEEVLNFKMNREKDIIDLIKHFYEEKHKLNIDIKNMNDISIIKDK
jgi:hypothetical protein